MSRAWTWRNAILASKLPATTKHVLMVISCHMNDMGEGCYPSTKRLAELGSLSERSVCTHIDDAEKAGWLKVTKHGFNGQRWARHEYSPLWPSNDNADWKQQIPRTKPANDQEKETARKFIGNALYQGRLQKGTCLVCGDANPEAHHPDYSKPEQVIWLCRAHHKEFHAWEKRTEPPSVRSGKRTEPLSNGTESDDKNALNVVQSNISGEQLSETPTLPLTPSGGMWESDSDFMDLVQRYSALNPDRADCRKAWEVWQIEKLAADSATIFKALPIYAAGEQWQREDGRYVPSLSKWLSDRGWKNVAAGLPTPEQLRERERIGKAGVDAYARIQNAKQWGREPDPADLDAVKRWEEMKQGKAS